MEKKENSYRNILKGTSTFASVQVFLILVNLIRGKFTALFLGPEGMGISAIFNNVNNTITKASSLGLNLAIVKEAADSREESARLSALLSVSMAMTQLTALLGAVICVLFCVPLSRVSFGTSGYAWQFVLLGAAVYFNVSGNARLSLLQGLHKVKRIAKASLVAALTGLAIGVPLYWKFGDKGIVPAIVVMQFSMYAFYTWNLRRECGGIKPDFKLKRYRTLVKKLIALGMVLLAGDLIGSATQYGVNIVLRIISDLETVGLLQASSSLANQYAGVVFTAMSLDYFPRLAASISDKKAVEGIVSRQMEVVATAMAPLACVAISLAPLVIHLLLTKEFEGIMPLFRLMCVGTVLKALQFPLGYISFANDNKRLFFWLEAVLTNILYAAGVLIGYHLGGLVGIGWAYIIENGLAIVIYTVVNRHYYAIMPSGKAWTLGACCTIMAIACWAGSKMGDIGGNLLMWISTGVAAVFCFYELRRMLKTKPKD